MFSTPEFWVFIAFVLFIGFFGKQGAVFLIKTLDNHRQKVAQQLDEAQRLHDEALSLLNSYKKKHEDAVQQANAILASIEKEALAFKKSSKQDLEELLAQKEKALVDRITFETEVIKSKLRSQAADEALAIVENILLKDLNERKRLTQASLKKLSRLNFKSVE